MFLLPLGELGIIIRRLHGVFWNECVEYYYVSWRLAYLKGFYLLGSLISKPGPFGIAIYFVSFLNSFSVCGISFLH